MSESTTEQVLRVDAYPTHEVGGFRVRAGKPFPFGANVVPGGVSFSVFSDQATSMTLVIYKRGEAEPMAELQFPEEFRTGSVFAMTVFGLDHENIEYGYRADGPYDPVTGHRFDARQVLSDPYARLIMRPRRVGRGAGPQPRLPVPLAGLPPGLRLGRRHPAADPRRGPRGLRGPRARLHPAPLLGGHRPRHLRGAAREDPVPQGTRDQLHRAAPGVRVRRERQPAQQPGDRREALRLLGLQHRLLLRTQGRPTRPPGATGCRATSSAP